MESKKWYARPDMIVALSALLVSLVAVIVGAYSALIPKLLGNTGFSGN